MEERGEVRHGRDPVPVAPGEERAAHAFELLQERIARGVVVAVAVARRERPLRVLAHHRHHARGLGAQYAGVRPRLGGRGASRRGHGVHPPGPLTSRWMAPRASSPRDVPPRDPPPRGETRARGSGRAPSTSSSNASGGSATDARRSLARARTMCAGGGASAPRAAGRETQKPNTRETKEHTALDHARYSTDRRATAGKKTHGCASLGARVFSFCIASPRPLSSLVTRPSPPSPPRLRRTSRTRVRRTVSASPP